MAVPTESGALFDLFAGDTTLMALLGTFTFKNGSTAPGLSRLWPNEPREQGSRCSGVEVSIARIPAMVGRGLWTGETQAASVVRIFVTQWAFAPGGAHNLDAVVKRILVLLDGQADATPAGLPDGLTGLGQVVIRYATIEEQLAGPEN
jgi:hypothetical protein